MASNPNLKKEKKIEEKSRLTPVVKLLNRIPISEIRVRLFALKTQIGLHRKEFGALVIFLFEFSVFGLMTMFALHMLLDWRISIGGFLGSASFYYVVTQLMAEWHESKNKYVK